MSRHNRAQTTPTHASGFHLFTVAMTGHAKDKGVQLPQQVTVESLLYWCSKREQERESRIVSEWTRGFCLPGTSEDNIESSSVSTITSSVSRLSRGDKYRQHRREHNQCNAHYDACSWHGNMNVFWANATSNGLNEVGLNTRFKFKLHMWLFKCPLFDLC